MPRLALEGKRILFLDGANCADPRLMARLAERRGMPFAQFNQQIMMARAFTCFQLTELISRVPLFLTEFPAQVLIITAFPELYFDEDIRHADASAAFQQALGHLHRYAGGGRGAGDWGKAPEEPQGRTAGPALPTLTVALFSSASSFQPPAGRKLFFAQTCAAAAELWKFQADEQGRLGLLQIGAGDWGKALPLTINDRRLSMGSIENRQSTIGNCEKAADLKNRSALPSPAPKRGQTWDAPLPHFAT
jgi:hypothetical protein